MHGSGDQEPSKKSEGFIEKANGALNRWMDAGDYINSLSELPPTYSLEKHKVQQWVPDPVSKESIRYKANKVDKAQKALLNPSINEKRNAILRAIKFD